MTEIHRGSIFSFSLPRQAQRVVVRIFNSEKQMVAQIEEGMMPLGYSNLSWNGRMLDGTRAVSGDYHFEVLAYDEMYRKFSGETKTSGVVTGVRFEDGEILLTVDNQRQVFLKDVTSLKFSAHLGDNLSELKKNAASSYSIHKGQQGN